MSLGLEAMDEKILSFVEGTLTFFLNLVEFLLRNIIWIGLLLFACWVALKIYKKKKKKERKTRTYPNKD